MLHLGPNNTYYKESIQYIQTVIMMLINISDENSCLLDSI